VYLPVHLEIVRATKLYTNNMKMDLTTVLLLFALFSQLWISALDLSDSPLRWKFYASLAATIIFGLMFLVSLVLYFSRRKYGK
jgi:hypothetical protein